MWSYYGSKSKIVHLYPKPKHDKIIEPFAGSARYALRYFDRDVLLVDKYEVVVKIWKWLQQCSPADILGLPQLELGMNIKKLNLSPEEFLFLSMCVNSASGPRYVVSKMCAVGKDCRSRWKKIADQLHKLKHWEIVQGSYLDIPEQKATWFVDPPYEFGGHIYIHSNKNIDFTALANWCETRQGQVIVCENTKATWMPFRPLTKIQGVNAVTTEAIWCNEQTSYDYQQSAMF